MKKYLTLIYITISVMSFAQFTDNVFEQSQTSSQQSSTLNSVPAASQADQNTYTPTEVDQSSSMGVPGPGEQEEGPGNPGEPPVPIDDYIPYLFVLALLMAYYQVKNKKINI